ncbi:MAG: tetratricopeptide repeat protein [Terriglobia bacterium]
MSNSYLKLSLCMIVRNEERHIGQCLASVKDFVDEIVIVDTGCKDQTMTVAKDFGANTFRFPWTGDFSEARNFSISMATGDWILVLDADEQLAERDARQMRSWIHSKNAHGLLLSQRTYLWDANYVCAIPNPRDYEEGRDFTNCIEVFVIRLFRNCPQIRYQGRVHELVEPAFLSHSLPFEKTPWVIHHYGKVVDADRLAHKKQLYLDLGKLKAFEEPGNPMAQFEIGVQLYEVGKFEESIPYFDSAYQLDKTFNLSLLYAAKAWHLLGETDRAGEYYQQCLTLAPNNERVLFEYANFQRDRGHLKKALKFYEKAISLAPHSALSVFNMGGVRLRLGQIDQGFNLLRKALRLNPDNESFHENFGKLALQGYDLEHAAGLLEDFLRRFPESKHCPPVLAEIYFKLKRFTNAIQWISRTLEINPSNQRARLLEAHSKFSLGRLEEAAHDYRRVLDSDPKNEECYMNLAAIAEYQKDLQLAEDFYGRLLEQDPRHPQALKKYATLKANSLSGPEALLLWQRVYLQNPEDTECLLWLGHFYEQCNQREEAIELFRNAQQKNPKLAPLASRKIQRLLAHTKTTPAENDHRWPDHLALSPVEEPELKASGTSQLSMTSELDQ